MTETPPDRLSNNPKSPFYDAPVLERGVGIRFNGGEKTNVDEYCVSEGWIRVTVGVAQGSRRQSHDAEAHRSVEAYFRDRRSGPCDRGG
jgi:hypothetical protein